MAMTKDQKNERARQLRWERQDRIYQRVKDRFLHLYLGAPKQDVPPTHDDILAVVKTILAHEDYAKLDQYRQAKVMGVHEAMHEFYMRGMVYTHVVDGRRVERDDPVLKGRHATLDTSRSCYCYKLADGRYLPMNADQRALDH